MIQVSGFTDPDALIINLHNITNGPNGHACLVEVSVATMSLTWPVQEATKFTQSV